MDMFGSKNRVTSRRSGQRRNVWANVATFPRGAFKRRDVGIQCRDIAEKDIFNVATLETNVVTCLRGLFSTSRR